jgi:RNA polymerase sigma-70 factor (ECF subfamily)
MRPELIEAAKLLNQGAPESVERALGLLQNTVYSFSMKVCGHPQDAEDTMQEVLFGSVRYLSKLQEPKALAVWLYTVTRNRCWRMRRKGRDAAHHALSLDELMPGEDELERLLRDPGESPESQLLEEERREALRQAVLGIPPPLRIVLVLHDMEELSTEQTAEVLALRPGTVRVRLHRARLAVRRELHRSAEPPDEQAPRMSAKRRSQAAPGPRRKFAPRKHPAVGSPVECRELFAGLSEYLDGNVPQPTCDEMRRHIEACPACVGFVRDLQQAIERCRALEMPCDPAVTARLRGRLIEEYRRLLSHPAPEEIAVTT